MSDATALLTRKLGPLPVWAYGAIVAGLAWGWYFLTSREIDSSPSAFGDDAGNDAGSWDEYFGNVPDGSSVGNGTGGDAVTPGSTMPTDNADWFRKAAQHLLALNYEGVSVSTALTKYLSGEPLTLGERALVAQAIARWGVPPEGVPPQSGPPPTDPAKPDPTQPPTGGGSIDPVGAPVVRLPPTGGVTPIPTTPTPAPTPVPSSGRTVTVTVWPTKLSTLSGIAAVYLGSGSKWPVIWNAPQNAAVRSLRKEPRFIRAGDKFFVPGAK